MITVTEKSRIALSALAELASRGDCGPVPIVDVAESRGIALHVLEQIFGGLRRAGVLQSQRGVKGGYSLGRPAAEITAADVVAAVDGPIGATARADSATARVFLGAAEAARESLAGVTVADVLEGERRVTDVPMFHI